MIVFLLHIGVFIFAIFPVGVEGDHPDLMIFSNLYMKYGLTVYD